MKRVIREGSLGRREFLTRSAAMLGGISIIPATALGAEGRTAANSRIVMGAIGMGGRGVDVMKCFMNQPDVQFVAVCDAIAERRKVGCEAVNQQYGTSDCAVYTDFRELLERTDIDAVLIATGDNNHSMVSLMAARAGKDMYCEKPMSVTIAESRAVADTMRRLGRVYQCGTQRRSVGNFIFACHLARSGKLGKLKELHAEEAGGFQELYETVLPAEPEPPRDVMDWNAWLGPALWRPYNSKYASRGFWSAHTDFSGGSITEWGSHTVDLCQWANGADDTSPVEYWKDGNRWMARYENGATLVIRTGLRFGSCPVRFEGEEGWVETGDSGELETHPKSLMAERGFKGGYPVDDHARDFLNCVYSRQQPVANADVAHRSVTTCHVANICKRLGRAIKWDPVTETCIGDEEANRMRSRAYRAPWYL